MMRYRPSEARGPNGRTPDKKDMMTLYLFWEDMREHKYEADRLQGVFDSEDEMQRHVDALGDRLRTEGCTILECKRLPMKGDSIVWRIKYRGKHGTFANFFRADLVQLNTLRPYS
jgi:hypothetical protein